VASTVEPTKTSMEQCVTDIRNWINPLYALYIKCRDAKDNHLKKTRECDGKQHIFEGDFCQYATTLAAVCSTQKKCRETNKGLLKSGDESLKVAEKAREADCKVGYKVQCLLGVFEESDNAKKPGILEACKKQVPTCPAAIDYPPVPVKFACEPEPSEPCENDWLQKEYISQSWYSKAFTKKCVRCHPPHPCKVTLYGGNLDGWSAVFFPGVFNLRELKRHGAKDDAVSSIAVEAGCRAEVYVNPDLSGEHAVFVGGNYATKEFVKKFPNNKVSSLRVVPPG